MVNLLDVYISIIIKVFIKIVSLDIAKKVDVYYDYLFLVYSFIHSLSFRYCYVFWNVKYDKRNLNGGVGAQHKYQKKRNVMHSLLDTFTLSARSMHEHLIIGLLTGIFDESQFPPRRLWTSSSIKTILFEKKFHSVIYIPHYNVQNSFISYAIVRKF